MTTIRTYEREHFSVEIMANAECVVIAVTGPAPMVGAVRNVLRRLAPTAIHPLGWTDDGQKVTTCDA